MRATIRNLTKDYDKELSFPMEDEKLESSLGKDEWILIDAQVGEELTDINQLNKLFQQIDEETIFILSKAFYLEEIFEIAEKQNFSVVNFTEETAQYNAGNGVSADDWWKGRVLFDLGYEKFPFRYLPEMENYLKFEQLWYTADSEGWVEVTYCSNTYLVKRWEGGRAC